MNYLNSYLRSKLDLSHIGLMCGEKESNYFCTPVLSKVIGWADVDGIHFCVSKNFGEIVFAVSPANLPARHDVSINDIAMRPAGNMGITWVPNQNWNVESQWFLEHYDLDLSYTWQIYKVKYFWPACGKMDIQKISLTMKQHPVSISGTHFKTPDAGNCVILTHPQTEKEYILHIDELKQETADFSRLHDQMMEYPSCYTQLMFRIEPDMA